jgi:cytochrome bd-type quinol oxidase subunit 2
MMLKLIFISEATLQDILNRLPESILILTGIVFVFLMWWLPFLFTQKRDHGGGLFTPGLSSIQEALKATSVSFTTAFSILSVILSIVTVSYSQEQNNPIPIILGIITFIIFSVGLISTIYPSLMRPLSGTAPTTKDVFRLLRLLFWGLGFTMFTLASILW